MTIALVDNWNPQSPLFSNNIEFLKRASKSGGTQVPPSEPPLCVTHNVRAQIHLPSGLNKKLDAEQYSYLVGLWKPTSMQAMLLYGNKLAYLKKLLRG